MSLFVIHRVDERGQHLFYRGSLAYVPAWTTWMREAKKYDTESEARRAAEPLAGRTSVQEGQLV